MRLSQNFTKTTKDIPADESSKNAILLMQGGFVDKPMAGVYAMLPLGLKVLNKIENIVRKHLNKAGSQEMLMNTLHPKHYWESTDRWESVDILFKLKSQTGNDYAVAASHEEQVTPIVQRFVNSWKDLPDYDEEKGQFPLSVYQIQTKFRDELRAKSGLLRGREFRMKDAYDFHKSEESLDKYYEKMKQTYFDIYKELGLEVYAVEASGGIFTQNMSHEFQTPCEAGEDYILVSKKTGYAVNEEIIEDLKKAGKEIPDDLEKIKVAEIGNIFKLSDKYSKAFGMQYTDQNNQQKNPIMGCHGIGTSRCMAVIAENFSDEKGLVWPKSVAPFRFHLITHINKKDDSQTQEKIQSLAGYLYNKLGSGEMFFCFGSKKFKTKDDACCKGGRHSDKKNYNQNLDNDERCLWDDREDISLGFKLKDADLIGCPIQVILTKRSLENGGVEVKLRKTGESFIAEV